MFYFQYSVLETTEFLSYWMFYEVLKGELTNIFLVVNGSDDNISHWVSSVLDSFGC